MGKNNLWYDFCKIELAPGNLLGICSYFSFLYDETALFYIPLSEFLGVYVQEQYRWEYSNYMHSFSSDLLFQNKEKIFLKVFSRAGQTPKKCSLLTQLSAYQSWALLVFFHFFNNKNWFFSFFIKLIWLWVGFLNRTGAEIGYQLDKKCKKFIFYHWKN